MGTVNISMAAAQNVFNAQDVINVTEIRKSFGRKFIKLPDTWITVES